MFEVGRLVARISLEGAQTFGRDVRQVGQEFRGLSKDGQTAARDVSAGMLGMGAGLTAFAGLAIARAASFDQAMSRVQAATGATAAEQQKLRDAAKDAGAETVYSAEESANAIDNLARAGVSTGQILSGGLAGSLSLAAAGELEVADAAEIAATAMTQFRLSGEEIPHLADLLAAGAGKAQGSVGDLGMALKQSGLVASQMGLSVEDTIGTLTAFASAGLLGSDAGTSFRTMLLALANPSKEAAATMKEFNIQAYDANGKMRSVADISEQLRVNLGGQEQATRDAALATIFGSDAIRAANVLYNNGAEGIKEWTAAVDESGFAAKQAGTLQDNLAGDVEKLGGAIDSALITAGEGATGVLRDMTQAATGMIDAYSGLPDVVQQGALGVALFGGAILLASGLVVGGTIKLAEFRTAVRTVATEMPVATARVKAFGMFMGGPWGVALTAAITILSAFAGQQADSAANVEELTSTLDAQTGAFTDATRAAVAKRIQDSDGFEVAKRAGIGQKELTDALIKGGSAAAEVEAKVRAYHKELGLSEFPEMLATSKLIDTISDLPPELDRARDGWTNTTEAVGENEDATAQNAEAQVTLEDAVDGVVTSLQDLYDEMKASSQASLDARGAAREYQAALDDFDATVQKNGQSLDITTEAGRENQAALDDIASAAYDAADAILANGGSTDDYRASLVASRQDLLNRIHDLGVQGQEAEDLADDILSIPTDREVRIQVDADRAAQMVANFKALLNTIPGSKMTSVGVSAMPNNQGVFVKQQAEGGILEFYAGGGRHEQHVAQIARTGTTRVWAEPETEGEMYAPLAPSKRARSLAIIGQTVGEWGYDLVPRGQGGTGGDAAVGVASLTGMRIAGTLDMGNGLTGLIEGVVQGALDTEADKITRGRRTS